MGKLQTLSVGFQTTKFGLHARTCVAISRFALEIGRTTRVELITNIDERVNAKDLSALLRLGYPSEMTFSLETDVPEESAQETAQLIRQRMEKILTSC